MFWSYTTAVTSKPHGCIHNDINLCVIASVVPRPSLRAPHPGAGILSARNPVQSLRARSFGRGNLLVSKARLLHSVRNDRLLCRESFLGVKRSNLGFFAKIPL